VPTPYGHAGGLAVGGDGIIYVADTHTLFATPLVRAFDGVRDSGSFRNREPLRIVAGVDFRQPDAPHYRRRIGRRARLDGSLSVDMESRP
jgi:hypothetical protein